MTIQLDVRLPLSLFRKVPFLFTALNYKSFPMGTPFDYLTFMNENIPVFLPLTLYHKEGNSITDLLFVFSFPFIDADGRLAIYLTHPVWLEKSDFSIIHTMLDELNNYFSEIGEVTLHLELQVILPSTSSPSYPTSLTHFSYDAKKLSDFTFPLKEYHTQLQEAGFKEFSRLLCYECEIETLLKKLHVSDQMLPYEILKEIKGKNLSISVEDVTPSDMIVKNYSFADQLSFISPQYTFEVGDYNIISFYGKEFVGFLQWTPNLFELPKITLPIPFLYPDLIQTHQFTTGKIFRFGLKIEDIDLFKGLLHKTVLTMSEKGVNTCQIGYIDEQNDFLTSLLDRVGFNVIHSLQILQKEV